MLNLLSAEWTKLRTTASFYWTTGIILVSSLGFTLLVAAPVQGNIYIPFAVVGMLGTIFSVITIVQATMVVTTEYRFGLQATNFRLTPQRGQVAISKLLLYGVIAIAISLITLVLCFTLGDALANVPVGWTQNPLTSRALWAIPLSIALTVPLCQGMGWLVRNTAGAITGVFALQFVAEPVIGFIPKVGRDLAEYMPFSNLYAFMLNAPLQSHGTGVSIGIFATWAVVIWFAGVMLMQSRDA